MRNRTKGMVTLAACAAAGGLLSLLPDAVLTDWGGRLSPRGAVSAAFLPVFRRLVVVAGVLGCAGLGLLAGWRRVWMAQAVATGRDLREEWARLREAVRGARRRTGPAEWAAILVCAGVGLGLRLWYLDQPMRFDEATTACLYVSAPWYLGIADYSMPNNHVFNTLLMRISIVWFGNREWVLRLPAFFAGLACLPLAYAYARRMHSRAAAVLALALISVGLPFVDMATNGRGYSFVAACGLAMVLCAEVLLRRGSRLAWFGYALSAGLSLVAVPVALPFVLTSVIWALAYAWILHRRGRQVGPNLRRWVGAGIAGAVLVLVGYAPILFVSGLDRLVFNSFVTPDTVEHVWAALPGHLMDYAAYVLANLPEYLPWVLAVAGAWYVIRWRRIERTGLPLSVLMAGVCTGMLLAGRRFPVWGLSPMWMTLSIVGLAALSGALADLAGCVMSSRGVRVGASGLAVFLAVSGAWGLVRANPAQTMDPLGYYSFADADEVVEYLAGQANPEDEILMDNGLWIHHYYTWVRGATNLSWSWEGSGPRRVFALETPQTNLRYARAMRDRLRELGIERTGDMKRMARFPNHRIWMAEVE